MRRRLRDFPGINTWKVTVLLNVGGGMRSASVMRGNMYLMRQSSVRHNVNGRPTTNLRKQSSMRHNVKEMIGVINLRKQSSMRHNQEFKEEFEEELDP